MSSVAPPVAANGGRRRRRRSNTPEETGAILVVGIVAALAAVAWSEAAPTGLVVVDAAYRAGIAVLMVVAGERSRRWSLVFGSAICAAFAVGPARLVALLAFALILVMVAVDRRSRVIDALVGGSIGVAALSLELGGPLGVESVVAVVALVPVLVSAYRYTTRKVQRRWRRAITATVLIVAVLSVASALAASRASSSVAAAIDETRDGVDAVRTGQEGAGEAFARASEDFSAADSYVGAPWIAPARLVPIVGPNLAVLHTGVQLGERLTNAAGDVAMTVDFDQVQRPDGGVDLDVLESFSTPISRAAETSATAAAKLDALDSPWIVGPLDERVGRFSEEVAKLKDQADLAELAVQDGPALLGRDGPRRYLVLLGNPAELRDQGGHIGNWAELVLDDGHMELAEVGGPGDLAVESNEHTDAVQRSLTLPFATLKPTQFPQNWGGDPDMSEVLAVAAPMFEQAKGRQIDGVFYADTAAFAAFLQLSGPVRVPLLEPPFELNGANAQEFLTRGQFDAFEREVDANAALTQVIDEVFSNLTSSQLPAPDDLGSLLSPIVRGGHLTAATTHAEDRTLLGRLGLLSELDVPAGRDLLAVVQRNAGPNKIDSYLNRSTSVDVQWNPVTGDVRSVVTVTLRNDAPADGLDPLIGGNREGYPAGSNVTDISVLTPFILRNVEVNGVVAPAQPLLVEDHWRHNVRTVIPAGETRVVTFELIGEVDPGDRYVLDFAGQPVLGENTLDVKMHSVGVDARAVGETTDTSGLDAGADYVFSWTSGK